MEELPVESSALTLKVESLQTGTETDPSQYQIDIYFDKSLHYTTTFGSPLTLTLPPSNSILQLVVRSAQPESQPVGSIGFHLAELIGLPKNVSHKHWITLFDDEDDNLYDGDYEEDDADLPKILIEYDVRAVSLKPVPEEKPVETNEILQSEATEPQQNRAGISFGPNFGSDEKASFRSKKDSDVIIKTPTKSDVRQSEPLESPKLDSNLFTLSTHGKESPEKAENPLLFSRQAIIRDSVPGNDAEPAKNSTVEFASSAEKAEENAEPSAKSSESPRFGTSPKEPPQKSDTKKLEADLITGLNDRVTKLKAELGEVESEKTALLQKHQKEVQQFDTELADWVKDKHELKNKIVGLEYELSIAQETAHQKAQEVAQLKEFYENERELKEQEYGVKIAQLESRVKTLQGFAESDRGGDKKAKVGQELDGLTKEYEGKVRVMHEELMEVQAKSSEYLQALQQSELKSQDLATSLSSTQYENEALRKELETVKAVIESYKKKCSELSNQSQEAEKTHKRKLGELIQENVAVRAKGEEYRILADQSGKTTSELEKQISGLRNELAGERAQSEKRSEKARAEIEGLKKEIERKNSEIELLGEKCKNLEEEYLKHEEVLEDGVRKDKVIASLEGLVEDYRATNEKLLSRLQCEKISINFSVNESEATQKMPKGVSQSTSKKTAKKMGGEFLQIQELGENYNKLMKQMEELNAAIKPKTEENEMLKRSLAKCHDEIEELRGRLIEDGKKKEKAEEKVQSPTLDKVDQMLVQHMNKAKCPVILRKLGQGEYIFGTRKIFAKIHNGKLVIRVGGGFLLVDEFLRIYTSHELGKLEKAQKQDSDDDPRNRIVLAFVIFYENDSNQQSGTAGGPEEEEFYYEVPQGGRGKIQFRSPQRKAYGIESAKIPIQPKGDFKETGSTTDRTKKKLSFGFKK